MSSRSLSSDFPLVLGSQSPRRRQILEGMGVPIRLSPADVDEGVGVGETPETYVVRIAQLKAAAVAERLSGAWALLVADTTVTIDGAILGKPETPDEARRMLAQLSGRVHQVLTRYAIWTSWGAQVARTIATEVEFRPLGATLIDRYILSGEGADKAGSYALQGKGAQLVLGVRGSVSGVIGLPAAEVSQDLEAMGLWEPLT